jgi:hypothetical protein
MPQEKTFPMVLPKATKRREAQMQATKARQALGIGLTCAPDGRTGHVKAEQEAARPARP